MGLLCSFPPTWPRRAQGQAGDTQHAGRDPQPRPRQRSPQPQTQPRDPHPKPEPPSGLSSDFEADNLPSRPQVPLPGCPQAPGVPAHLLSLSFGSAGGPAASRASTCLHWSRLGFFWGPWARFLHLRAACSSPVTWERSWAWTERGSGGGEAFLSHGAALPKSPRQGRGPRRRACWPRAAARGRTRALLSCLTVPPGHPGGGSLEGRPPRGSCAWPSSSSQATRQRQWRARDNRGVHERWRLRGL